MAALRITGRAQSKSGYYLRQVFCEGDHGRKRMSAAYVATFLDYGFVSVGLCRHCAKEWSEAWEAALDTPYEQEDV